jgi:hypothetical protein
MLSNCRVCKIEFKYTPSRHYGIYCSSTCKGLGKQEETYKRFLLGKVKERRTIRKCLIKRDGDCCSICNITDWNGQLITFQVDHIDGNPGNNTPENLRLVCPNCHSQTPFYGGRNKGNGRRSRGLPLR